MWQRPAALKSDHATNSDTLLLPFLDPTTTIKRAQLKYLTLVDGMISPNPGKADAVGSEHSSNATYGFTLPSLVFLLCFSSYL